jgi:predicted ATPase/DNA-binding SARP family transcriptional activator
MRVQLLGEFGIDVGGQRVAAARWRLRKARTLVKLLALEPTQRLHREFLLDLLWPDLPPAAAANNLHQALHAARRALAGGGTAGLLELRGQVVVLWAGGLVDVDAARFGALARAALDGGDLADLRAARAAYHGDLLPEDRYETWARGPRDDLRALHRDVLVLLGGRMHAAGQHAEAEAALEEALAGDPLHEPALRSLLRVLADQGRRSEALVRYESLRDDLRTAYGTDPDPETRRCYRELLLGGAPPDQPAPDTPATPRPNNLPASATSFVGRERELAQVHRLLRRTQLLTLTGPGGAGKTRLALAAARSVAAATGGAWYVDLVPVHDRHLVADTVAITLGLAPAAGRDPLRTLAHQLAGRRMLVVLDNCEHLLSECARVAAALLAQCPGVSLLATSREPLHVEGEVILRVPSLAVPPAGAVPDPAELAGLASVRLFTDRAADFRPDFTLNHANAAAVAAICRRLDGMPLAIELAAARTAYLEPAEIAGRLDDALSVLGRSGTATRHATLRATLEWSHDLLDAQEQCLLRRLAVFEGGCALSAAEHVCAGGPLPGHAVLDVLGRLVDKSLVQVEGGTGRSRYRLLETVRQLAAERLGQAGETGALRTAHGRYFGELAAEQERRASAGVMERPQLLDVEHDNLRAALVNMLRDDPDQALALAVSLWRFWMARGHYVEGAEWLRKAMLVASDAGQLRAEALRGLAVLEVRRGHVDRARKLGEEAVTLPGLVAGPELQVVSARLFSGLVSWIAGDLGHADEIAADTAKVAARLGRPDLGASAHWLAALIALFREDTGVARQELSDCLDKLARVGPGTPPFFPAASIAVSPMPVAGAWVPVFEETGLIGRRVGAAQAAGYVWSAIASAHRLDLHPVAALGPVQAAVRAFHSLGDAAGLGLALNHLGCVERDLGDPAAVGHLTEALRLREQLGDRRAVTVTLANRGLAEAAAGEADRGRASVRAALAQVEAVEDRPGASGTLLDLAVVELIAGETHAARSLAGDAVELFSRQGYRRLDAVALTFAAELAAREGDARTARRHAEQARLLFAGLHCGPGVERALAIAATC